MAPRTRDGHGRVLMLQLTRQHVDYENLATKSLSFYLPLLFRKVYTEDGRVSVSCNNTRCLEWYCPGSWGQAG